MRAIWLEDGKFTCRDDLPAPVAGDGEALVRVDLAGICGTDLALRSGYRHFTGIPGHEFVGTVIDGVDEWRGKKVVADINIGCGHCEACVVDPRGHHCANRRVVGIESHPGVFAEWLAVPCSNLVAVPEGIAPEVAVLAEPLAAALHVLDDVPRAGRGPVLVIGAGRLGTLIVWVFAMAGFEVHAVARNPRQAERLPASVSVLKVLPAKHYSVVVECTGDAGMLAQALMVTAPRGTLIVKSTSARTAALDTSRLVVNEIRMIGSRCGDLAAAIAWMLANELPASLAPSVYPLEMCEAAFQAAIGHECFKVAFAPASDPSAAAIP